LDTVSGETEAYGTDIVAGPVDGNRFTIGRNGFYYEIEFASGFEGDFNTITVDGGALTFALSEDTGRRSTLAIPSLLAAQLGGVSGKLAQLATGSSLSLATLNAAGKNSSDAIRVLDEALADLTRADGSVDGFYNAAVTSASNVLSDLQDDLESAIDDINLVDDNEEAMRAAYFQDLAANAVAGLSILRQQRYGIVRLIQQMAGLI